MELILKPAGGVGVDIVTNARQLFIVAHDVVVEIMLSQGHRRPHSSIPRGLSHRPFIRADQRGERAGNGITKFPFFLHWHRCNWSWRAIEPKQEVCMIGHDDRGVNGYSSVTGLEFRQTVDRKRSQRVQNHLLVNDLSKDATPLILADCHEVRTRRCVIVGRVTQGIAATVTCPR